MNTESQSLIIGPKLFKIRGMRSDKNYGCFVSGAQPDSQISRYVLFAQVANKKSGEDVVAMFGENAAKLD